MNTQRTGQCTLLLAALMILFPAARAAEVEWTNVVNAAAVGSSLAKTGGCNGCDDAGAQSSQQLDAGNVYMEFTVPDVSQALVAGLGNEGEGTSVAEIDFGIRIQNGVAEAIESGFPRMSTQAANGDVYRISVENGVVSYFRNNTAFYTSDQQPQYPLRADITLLGLNARVDSVMAVPFGGEVAAQQAQGGSGQTVDVVWTEMANVTMEGTTLIKTSGCDGCEDAGARSAQALSQGNVYVEFTIPDASKLLWVGLTNDRPTPDDANLDFAIRIQEGMAEVRENGEYQVTVDAANGDTFRISVENGTVSYYRNGQSIHTSSKAVEYPLYMATTLASQGAAVSDARAVPFSAPVALQ